MSEKVTPRVDLAFKKLFGVEENKDLLISLINSIVSKEDQVSDVELLNPYNPRNFKRDRLSILDIKAKGPTGKRYNIEIQISDEADYDKRALYYWGKLYTQQLKRSEDYSVLNKAIGIHILNFTSIPEVEEYHNVFKVFEEKTKVPYFNDLELHTIELNKFENNQKEHALDEEAEIKLLLSKVKTSLDRWVAFLTRYDLLRDKRSPKELKDPQIEKALEVLEEMNFTEDEREAYEDHLKWLRIEANTLKKMHAKGEAIGEARGIAKGKAEGKAEERIKIAKNLLMKNMSKTDISSITGLSVEEIEMIE